MDRQLDQGRKKDCGGFDSAQAGRSRFGGIVGITCALRRGVDIAVVARSLRCLLLLLASAACHQRANLLLIPR